jgi:hypothetical protein
MTAEEHRGLGLLLVLASSGCLGLPRYTDDGAGDDEGDGTTTPTVDDGPSPPDPPSVTTGPGPQPTTAADDAASFLFMPDVGPITSPTTAETSDVTTEPPPPPSEVCQAYSVLITECYDPETGEAAFGYCADYLEYLEQYMPECVPAFEDFMVCISALSCRELQNGGQDCEMELQKLQECWEI